MTRTLLALAVVGTLGTPAVAAPAGAPKLDGAPRLTFTRVADPDGGRFVSIAANVRLNRPFADAAEQHRYVVVAAPRLPADRRLGDELFGGTALGRYPAGGRRCYRGEAVQLRKRRTVRDGARWQVALATGSRIVGPIKTVTLRLARGAESERPGCL